MAVCMHGPDGRDYKNESIFVEIVRPERIILDHISGPTFRVTATFEEIESKTRVNFRQQFDTVAECEKVKIFAVKANEENFDRLEAELQRMS